MEKGEQPKATLDDVLAELKAQGARKKDLWDRLPQVSTFISTVVLGIAGLWFTHSYNERQSAIVEQQTRQDQENKKQQARILEMQAVEKFVPYLTTDDERKKEVALLVITTLGSPEFATQFAKLNPSQGTQAAADRIMASSVSTSSSAVTSPGTTLTSSAAASDGKASVTASRTGWVYLGQYVARDGRWETRYFDFPESADPASLASTSLAVRVRTGNINVRSGMPTESGTFPGVREVLGPGSKVKVKTVREWSYTGYMWAEVEYETSR